MASSTSLQVAGLASNFDWKGFVDQIMAVEHAPADRLTAEKGANSQKVTLLGALGTRIGALQTSAQALKSAALFGQRRATSATSGSTWSLAAGTETATGSYKIAVSQLATSAALNGATDVGRGLNPTTDNVSGLTLANLPLGQPATAGTFTVNGKQVTVALTDSLQDVFNAIATATGGDVTASYDHLTDKVTLASATTNVMLGAANDTSNFLRALKLANNGAGSVTSSGQLGTVKPSATLASANLSTAITAVDGTGAGTFSLNGVAINYNVNSDSLSTLLAKINDSTAGVSAVYDRVNDRVLLANKGTGDLGIALNEPAGGVLGALGLTSGTTFTRGKDAQFTLNGGDTLTSASNTLDASVHGITGLSVTVNSLDTQTVSVSADTSAMRTKIEAFVDSFNAVQQFLDTNTKVASDGKGKVTAAVLASNREIQEWGRSLRTLAFGDVGGLTGSVKRLNDLGIDFKTGTNELTLTSGATLDKALAERTGDVEAFFTTATTGFASKFDDFTAKVSQQNTDQQDRLNKSNHSLDEQIAAIERRLEQQRSLMESAFIQMENAQSRIKQQQTAVDGMVATLRSR